jgi:hypothetical protein
LPDSIGGDIETKAKFLRFINQVFPLNFRKEVSHFTNSNLRQSNLSADFHLKYIFSLQLENSLLLLEEIAKEQRTEPDYPFLSDFEGTVSFSNHVHFLFSIIEKKGAIFDGQKDREFESQLFYSAVVGALQLLPLEKFGDLSVERWEDLGWCFVDNDEAFISNISNLMFHIIRAHQVHLKFLVYPCLLANDRNLSRSAHSSLIVAFSRLRKTHEGIAARLLSEQDEKMRVALHEIAAGTMPENVMPYLLYLLSYHPQFPTSIKVDTTEDKSRFKHVLSCIKLLIQSLQSTLKLTTSNLPFLLKQLNTINHQFVDKLDQNNVGVHFVARLTTKLLQDQVVRVENLQVYPGEIFLPKDLFAAIEAGKAQVQLGMIAGDGLEGNLLNAAEVAVNQVYQFTHKKGKDTAKLFSPSKAAKYKSSPSSKVSHHTTNAYDSENDEESSKKRARFGSKQLPDEQPSRKLPSRTAKTVVKTYLEPDFSEKELELWNRDAGVQRFQKSPKIAKSSSPLVTANEFDVFASQKLDAGILSADKARRNTSHNIDNDQALVLKQSIMNGNNKRTPLNERSTNVIRQLNGKSNDPMAMDAIENKTGNNSFEKLTGKRNRRY